MMFTRSIRNADAKRLVQRCGKNYTKRIKENIKIIKKLPKVKGGNEILYPGQGLSFRYKKNLKKGIVIPKNILEEIKKLNAIK